MSATPDAGASSTPGASAEVNASQPLFGPSTAPDASAVEKPSQSQLGWAVVAVGLTVIVIILLVLFSRMKPPSEVEGMPPELEQPSSGQAMPGQI